MFTSLLKFLLLIQNKTFLNSFNYANKVIGMLNFENKYWYELESISKSCLNDNILKTKVYIHKNFNFQIEKYGINSVDVKEILLEMRKYRMGLIQTPEQLRFSYQAIIEGAKQLSQTSLSPDKQV